MMAQVRRLVVVHILCCCFLAMFANAAHASITWTEGRDGVRIYYPSTGWTWTEGSDGRRVVYPTNGWTWTESKNGRRIIHPTNGWTWTEDRTGNRIVYPTSGWTWTEGRDGQRAVYPTNGWTWTEGRDGHRVVYPTSGWTWWEDQSGRRIPYRTDGGPATDLNEILIEMLIQKIPLDESLRPSLSLLLDQMGWRSTYKTVNGVLAEAHAMMNMGYISEAREHFRYYARNGGHDEVRREAAYFTGYCSVVLGDMNQAAAEYRDFLTQYENSWNTALVPDAMYVLGIVYEYLNDFYKACDMYRTCIQRFPGSEMAQKSRERLKAHGQNERVAVSTTRGNTASVAAPSGRGGEAAMAGTIPFGCLENDRESQLRVREFIRSVEQDRDVAKAFLNLTADDKMLDSVRNALMLWGEKVKFSDLHKNSASDR
ncbi:tetratricopeptide repeat protein [Candidatus Ozemobacteraceae bacterium]|nr:tetratricopeptide repeat protein [Candidatus Ozemobacteraceae bacterium]